MARGRHVSGGVSRGSHTGGAMTDFRSPAGAVIANPVWGTNVTSDDGTLGLVTALQVTPGAVTGGALAPGAALGNIEDGSITGTQLSADSVNAWHIAANSIGANEIAAGSITADEIAAGTITGDQIAAGAITANDITTGTLSGIEIFGTDITAGGNGFNGLTIADEYGTTLGYWNGSSIFTYTPIHSSMDITCGAGYSVVTTSAAGVGGLGSTYEGALGIDYASGTDGRLYARHGSAWHYVPFAGGFVVPVHETICPVCEDPLLPGEDMIGRGDRYDADGSLHALYIHLKCAGKPMVQIRANSYWMAGRDDTLQASLTSEALAASGVVQAEWTKPIKVPERKERPPVAEETEGK